MADKEVFNDIDDLDSVPQPVEEVNLAAISDEQTMQELAKQQWEKESHRLMEGVNPAGEAARMPEHAAQLLLRMDQGDAAEGNGHDTITDGMAGIDQLSGIGEKQSL